MKHIPVLLLVAALASHCSVEDQDDQLSNQLLFDDTAKQAQQQPPDGHAITKEQNQSIIRSLQKILTLLEGLPRPRDVGETVKMTKEQEAIAENAKTELVRLAFQLEPILQELGFAKSLKLVPTQVTFVKGQRPTVVFLYLTANNEPKALVSLPIVLDSNQKVTGWELGAKPVGQRPTQTEDGASS